MSAYRRGYYLRGWRGCIAFVLLSEVVGFLIMALGGALESTVVGMVGVLVFALPAIVILLMIFFWGVLPWLFGGYNPRQHGGHYEMSDYARSRYER
jgi:hypothetical protein